jgi:hypothetical protein
MENILQSNYVISALKEDGIDNTFGLLMLTDATVDKLTYPDPDPNITAAYSLKKGEIGIIKKFIHFVHYCRDHWLGITQGEFDQCNTNLSYNRRFGTLSNLTTPVTTTSSTPSTSHNAPFPVDVFKRGIKKTLLSSKY